MIAKLRFLAPMFGAGAAAAVLAIAPMASADTPSAPGTAPAGPLTNVTSHIAENPGGGGCVDGVGCGHGGPGGGGGCVDGVGCGSGNFWEGGGGCVEGVGCGGWRP